VLEGYDGYLVDGMIRIFKRQPEGCILKNGLQVLVSTRS
jgi:hypothetical protein